MANHLVTSVLSMGLSILFILGVVALVAKHGTSDDDDTPLNSMAIHTICKPTEYTDACHDALEDVSKNSSSTKKDYIFASFRATIDELKIASEKATSLRKDLHGKKDDYSKYARADLKNCETLLGQASDELQHLLQVASKQKLADLPDQTDPILVRLTAIRAYQTTCVEEIKDDKLKNDMQNALEAANKNTYNSEKIMYNIPDILMEFGVELDLFHGAIAGHRRLLDDEEEEHEHDEYEHIEQAYFKTPEPESIDDITNVKPNVVVAQDGSGQYKTIKEALAAYPSDHKGRYVIHIKAGEYNEGQIIVEQNNVFMYGDGHDKTIITGSENYAFSKCGASQTATFIAQGERFMARGIAFRNTIGESGLEAVAFRSMSPHTLMVDCSFEGYQNTLYYHAHDQFYKNCTIYGTVDFIFGSGRAYIQDSVIYVRKPGKNQNNTILSDRRMKNEEKGGVVLQKCKIKATKELKAVQGHVKTYLGRPYKEYSKEMVMQTEIGSMLEPEGWTKMYEPEGNKYHDTCSIREFYNKGAAASTEDRPTKWKGYMVIKSKKYAKGYSADKFIHAGSWVPHAGVDVDLKL
ncbi:pectinesterase-like [Cynara cardunculus var. scolymus]|uniref:Pectinesterase n=1 Tax=Cynara cardunculus var. scolymus TaxID=59895 RepID=A0A103XPD8_CYNCS|nr:pectinesterase-like [Cynara cardunculus var. scolymus]KVH94516.1 Pectinesterase, active site-containing protein [Cynara cardunculus var. scolymus]